jgi:hypothetical protein
MSKLDDVFGARKKEERGWTAIDIEAACGECGESADEVFCSSNKKRIRTVCPEGHTSEWEMDLSWLIM